MKVISVIKKGRGEDGASYTAHYVSTRDRDEEREGKEPRKLFSASEDKLTASQANRLLGDGREVKTNDLLHVVVSLEKEEDFNRLGIDEVSRRRGVRETTRSAMNEMIDLFKAYDFRWAACIHCNTDNPHIHLLIHRDYVDRETGRGKRLNAFQRELRLRWFTAPDGVRVTNAGALSQAFEKHLERHIERAEEERRRNEHKTHEERLALGRAMMAEDHVEQLREARDAAIAYGERRHYKIIDARGRSRWFSEHDLRVRAGAAADRATARLSPDWNPETRRQMREGVFAEEMDKYKPLIRMIREMRGADLDRAESKLRHAVEASQPLIEKASAIIRRYESAGLAIPAPILTREEVSRLQERAIRRGDAESLRRLETLRVSLAAEKGSPARADGDLGRLQVWLFVARSSLIVERQSLTNLEEMKHIRRWVIDDNPGSARTEASLAEIEKSLAWESDQAKFIGARKLHWDDDKREKARQRADELSDKRERILQKIDNERARLSSQIARKAEVVNALSEILPGEEARYRREGRQMLTPIFTGQEMKELAAHAERRGDPEFYRELISLERDYDAHANHFSWIVNADRVSRATAREVMAEISTREAQMRLQRFTEQRGRTTVIVKDDGAQDIRLARIADVEPRTPLEQLFRPLIERSEKYRDIAAAVEDYGNRLTKQCEQASAIHAVLKETALEYEAEFVRQNPEKPVPRPGFTAWEIGKLELHTAKEIDPAYRACYEKLLNESLAASRDDSETRAPNDVRRTIVLSDRESASIFDSAFAESNARDFEDRLPSRFDRAAMSFER